uniref:Protein SCO1/2 n=1 Tax=Candidatus Kentrum sp. MB TaxID=2138164 RepID=A0A450XXR2_9GAMM|nr:MAG: protein SCO1/2 [Candidatus Kentron sp. MB]VFK34079.1 MAG: protein SCO1/2 [Candidatus Kentron sp. MB]VFK76577.1 MAG: protein SCO1/2 [Candidatus Kentron sp. MB]
MTEHEANNQEQKREESPISDAGLAVIGVVLIAIIAMLLWFGVAQREKSVNLDPSTTLLGTPKKVPSFSLTDHHGNPFTEARLHGQWTFLYFGYTSCPEVCPTTLGALVRLDGLLRQVREAVLPRFVFVSVDPSRDTQDQLARYMPYFSPNFLGVTGPEKEISALAQPLGIVYRRSYEDDPDNYLIDHSASVILVNPQGSMVAVMSPPHDARAMTENFRNIAANKGQPQKR